MNTYEEDITVSFSRVIDEAYKSRNVDVIEATGHLQCEASELAELYLKNRWYNKRFTSEDILSEAGDILNFLTLILNKSDLTLEDAIKNNVNKLKKRGWIL